MEYLVPCLVFVWLAYLWNTYLQWRQRGVYQTCSGVPEELTDIMDQDTFNKSRCYQLDKSSFSMAHELFKQLEFLAIIIFGGIPSAWNISGVLIGYYGYNQDYEVLQSVTFLLVTSVYSAITGLPWIIYSTFVLEEKHGFNKQTPWFFFEDQVKKFVLNYILMSASMAGLIATIKTIKWEGDYFYIYAWLSLVRVMMFIYHDFIALYDKYTPLPEGSLRTAIEKLASSLQFPLKKLLVVEGSKRSAHSNAYFYGFWNIVLFDTLVEEGIMPSTSSKEATHPVTENEEESKQNSKEKKGCNTAEILGVLAHELGHWKLSHNIINLVIVELNLLFTLFLFGYFMNQQDLYNSFGFPSSRPVLIGLILFFQLIFLPYNEVFSFLMTQYVRRCEYQADSFAEGLGHAKPLCSALIKLNKDNLIADPLCSAFHHSHPTLLERLRALNTKKTD